MRYNEDEEFPVFVGMKNKRLVSNEKQHVFEANLYKEKKRKLKNKITRKNISRTRKMFYSEYITSDAWFKKRDAFFRKNKYQCAVCSIKANVQVHHMSYAHLGDERENELVVLCYWHHQEYHALNGTQKNMIKKTVAFIEMKRAALV